MTNRLLLVLVSLSLGQVVLAGDAGPVSTLKVDVDEVVKFGAVEPVAGITSSGQPDENALRVFSDSGYAAVIDLRGAGEDRGYDEASAVENLGMDYVLLPIDGDDAISFDNARELDRAIGSYDGPVLIHCRSGNRVGALLALRESLNGADDEDAIAAGLEGGLTRLEGVVRERLEADGDD